MPANNYTSFGDFCLLSLRVAACRAAQTESKKENDSTGGGRRLKERDGHWVANSAVRYSRSASQEVRQSTITTAKRIMRVRHQRAQLGAVVASSCGRVALMMMMMTSCRSVFVSAFVSPLTVSRPRHQRPSGIVAIQPLLLPPVPCVAVMVYTSMLVPCSKT